MHSGFMTLRSLYPMNITQDLTDLGQQIFRESAELQVDVKRIEDIWAKRENPHGFLSGDEFTIVDAFYAPVVMRFKSYGLPVSDSSQHYMNTILNVTAVQMWMKDALHEVGQ
ncbi:glutathione S-transferase C-terminal domain-containing protein [Acinetobacter sp. CFCC 10889]|uniref:glutathione S-transferase C-terminal domain-containing protein n=1 Tax=Acinetobacter sp. CFCC 10889 TaxID=1775557 RepID=UPI002AF6B16B|nr:glutathione S-transferase C-terminal domain-containing protein [Acinetobacter sp. CFCC 10889]